MACISIFDEKEERQTGLGRESVSIVALPKRLRLRSANVFLQISGHMYGYRASIDEECMAELEPLGLNR